LGDHHCGFRCNRLTTDTKFCTRQILEKRWEYNGTVPLLVTDFEKVYDTLRRVLYNILTEVGIPMKQVLLIKMCLNETIVKFAHVKFCLMQCLFSVV
jgi:hypothetical protein